MFPTNSQELGSRYHVHKSLHQIVEELTTPGKLLIQFNGWRNVCQTLDYIFGHCYDIFDELSGISLEFEGLSQVVGYVYSAENLKKKALLGGTIITTTSFYTLDNERNGELLEGLDDLDRNLKKMKVWGCDFVILQIKLKCYKPFGARRVPFDNSEYFGIFSATTQALGMVPIIQFQYDILESGEEACSSAFVDTMYTINHSLFDFDVDISCLLFSPLINYSLKAVKDHVMERAETLINSLKQALPPAVGGVVFASQGSYKALGLQIDQLAKIISRVPWPIICCYGWKISTVLDSDTENLVLEKWVQKQRMIIKMLLQASAGKLVSWQGKVTVDIPDYISSHDYYDKDYIEAIRIDPPE